MAGKKKASRRTYHRRRLPKFKLKTSTVYTIVSVLFIGAAGILTTAFFQTDGSLLAEMHTMTTYWFGVLGLFVPVVLLSIGLLFLRINTPLTRPNVTIGLLLLFLSMLAMARSGYVGEEIWQTIAVTISSTGAWLLLLASMTIGISILLNTSLDEIGYFLFNGFVGLYDVFRRALWNSGKEEGTVPAQKKGLFSFGAPTELKVKGENPGGTIVTNDNTMVKKTVSSEPLGLRQTTVTNTPGSQVPWEYPPLSLLSEISNGKADAGDVRKNASVVEQTLDSFGIKARVVEVNLGPAVAQYALEIALGTKLSKITALANDLALALAAPTGQIRIEAPIPGRSMVGVEVPNRSLRVVTLKEMLMSGEIRKADSKLAIPLGLDVSGKPLIADIAKMPHILIAGTTGSGKSVMMNALITSLLYRTTPQELRMILVDPKRVEMTAYNDIPHLLTPVIVEADQTLSALKWAQDEMERRYKMFAEKGARNITSYNGMMGYQAIPYIVIFIDELADLMMFAPGEVEDKITRIAQMARATGIHLVLSTQRPSVNVITGLIKANIPTRVAFNVSSMIDSRVVLDMPGAEKLLGRGDMLYIPPDQAKPLRIQGTFISEKEVRDLVHFLKQRAKAHGMQVEYTEEVTQQKVMLTKPSGLVEAMDGSDPLFEESKVVVMQYDRASASLLQRRLKVGYARAARILDQLEAAGIVSPSEGSKPREVLTRNQ